MPYDVLKHKSLTGLIDEINLAEVEDWKEQGGIAYNPVQDEYMQAIVYIGELPELKLQQLVEDLNYREAQQ